LDCGFEFFFLCFLLSRPTTFHDIPTLIDELFKLPCKKLFSTSFSWLMMSDPPTQQILYAKNIPFALHRLFENNPPSRTKHPLHMDVYRTVPRRPLLSRDTCRPSHVKTGHRSSVTRRIRTLSSRTEAYYNLRALHVKLQRRTRTINLSS
jgi:hypothetical protein